MRAAVLFAVLVCLLAAPASSFASSRGENTASGVSGDYVNLLETRLQELEAQVQRLTNQAEQAGFQAQQAQSRLQRLEEDLNTRFRLIEERQAAASVAPSAPAASSPATSSVSPPPSSEVPSPSVPREKTLGQLTSSTTEAAGDTPPASDNPNTAYDQAFSKIRDGDYEAAESAMRAFLKKWPQHDLSSNAAYWLAESFYARGDYEDAAKSFAESYSGYPKGSKAEDTLVKLGLTLSALNRTNDACVTFDQAEKEFAQMSMANHRRIDQERKQLDCPLTTREGRSNR